MTTTHLHEIVEDDLGGKAVCHGETGAPCRTGCAAKECESWGGDECPHGPLADYGDCYAAEWLNASGLTDTRIDDEEGFCLDVHSQETYRGPIEIEWTGDDYAWSPTAQQVTA